MVKKNPPRLPRTTQRAQLAQLAGLVWVICAVFKTAQSWQLTAWPARAARAALASSRPGWVVFETAQITQSCQLGPGLARAARAAWPCLYVHTNRPDHPARSSLHQLVHQVVTWSTWSFDLVDSMSAGLVRVCPTNMSAPGQEYVQRVCGEYFGSIRVCAYCLADGGEGRAEQSGARKRRGHKQFFMRPKHCPTTSYGYALSGNFLQSRIQSNMIRA